VLEMIQWLAQREVGATIAQTHYATAATRPIAALPRLETLTQHHIPKIKNFDLRKEYQRLLTEINLAIGDSVPRTFDLEDQCIFHLGYYHQRAFMPYQESPHKHVTLNGDEVRSKSEVVVANILAFLDIKYEYEAKLCFKDHVIVPVEQENDRGVRTIKPDFTIRETPDGRPVYIEHLGMMDNFAYRSDWEDRQKTLFNLGILPFEDGGGPKGTLVTTREQANGAIDCRKLHATLAHFSNRHRDS